MKVLITDPISPSGLRLLTEAPGLDVQVRTDLTPEGLLAEVRDAEILVVRSRTKVTRAVIEAGTRLAVIARGGAGLDNIDVAAARERGIRVINTPGSNSIAVAELPLGLMLCLARSLPQADAGLRAGRWEKGRLIGWELHGKVLGIVGLGQIGREVARRAAAFGMSTVAHDPYLTPETAPPGIALLPLEQVLERADIVTLHVPLTEETRGLIGPKEIARMKPGARLVNTSRGEVVDEAALHEALSRGALAGAALDVFATEPPTGSPLLGLPNVVASPHIGAATHEAQERTGVDVARRILEALAA